MFPDSKQVFTITLIKQQLVITACFGRPILRPPRFEGRKGFIAVRSCVPFESEPSLMLAVWEERWNHSPFAVLETLWERTSNGRKMQAKGVLASPFSWTLGELKIQISGKRWPNFDEIIECLTLSGTGISLNDWHRWILNGILSQISWISGRLRWKGSIEKTSRYTGSFWDIL